MIAVNKLLSLGCANRADTFAGTAVNAGCSVDNILAVALGDCGNRTFACASAAADALIRNSISHDMYLLKFVRAYPYSIILLYHKIRKKQEVIYIFLFCTNCRKTA